MSEPKADPKNGKAGKGLDLGSDLEDAIDDMDTEINRYLALEAKLYKLSKKIFNSGKKVGQSTQADRTKIKEAKAGGSDKASVEKAAGDVEEAVADLKDSVDEYMFRTKRQLAMARRVMRTLK